LYAHFISKKINGGETSEAEKRILNQLEEEANPRYADDYNCEEMKAEVTCILSYNT